MQSFTVQSVTFGYRGQAVFKDLSLTIPRGVTVALTGGNGAGKSTLLSLLAGVHRPGAGLIRAHVPGRPALVVQRSAVSDSFPVTVRGAVGMGRWARAGLFGRLTAGDRQAVEDAMERMDIRELANSPIGELSGGQRQRTLVAQGLAQCSRVLLLDEPDAGLDAAGKDRLEEVLRDEVSRGVTVVRSIHDLPRAAAADCRIHLTGGKADVEKRPAGVRSGGTAGLEGAPGFP